MANKKITDDTTATSVAGTDKVFLNQGGDLKQVDLNSAVANSQAVQTLNSNTFKTDGLNLTNCSLLRGGYCKIGKLVIIEMRITIKNSVDQWGKVLSGLPNAGENEIPLTVKNITNNNIIELDITKNVMRNTGNTLSNVDLNISGCYISI